MSLALYCGVLGSPCLSKTGLVLARIFLILSSLSVCIWQFFGDPASLARDNIYIQCPLDRNPNIFSRPIKKGWYQV